MTLWHVTTARANDPGHSAATSLYFGQGETATGGGNYDWGQTAAGQATSPAISLSGISPSFPVSLTFDDFMATEADPTGTYDQAFVNISTNGGTTWTTVIRNAIPIDGLVLADHSNGWQRVVVPLDPFLKGYRGSILVQFSFNTVNALNNDYEGWYVNDDVRIEAQPVALGAATNGYELTGANAGDGLGIGLAGVSAAGPLDFNGDGTPDFAVMSNGTTTDPGTVYVITSAAKLPALGASLAVTNVASVAITDNLVNPSQYELTGFTLSGAGDVVGQPGPVGDLLLSSSTTSLLIPGAASPPAAENLKAVAIQFTTGGLVPLGDINGDGSDDLGGTTTATSPDVTREDGSVVNRTVGQVFLGGPGLLTPVINNVKTVTTPPTLAVEDLEPFTLGPVGALTGYTLTASAAAPGTGQLGGAADFTLSLSGGTPVNVTVPEDKSTVNVGGLVNDLNAALLLAGLGDRVTAGQAGGVLTFSSPVRLTIGFAATDPSANLGFTSGQSSAASPASFDAADALVGGQSHVFFGRALTPQQAAPSNIGPSLQEDLFQYPLATALPPAATTTTVLTLGQGQATASVSTAAGLSGSTAGERLSAAIDIGDFNGDGYDDYMFTDEPSSTYVGPVMSYILFGPIDLSTVTDVTARADLVVIDRYQNMAAPANAPAMGMPALSMGDITGDGHSDLVFVDDEVNAGVNSFVIRVIPGGDVAALPRLLNTLPFTGSSLLLSYASTSMTGVTVSSWAATKAGMQTNVTAQVLHWHEAGTDDILVSTTQETPGTALGYVFSTVTTTNSSNVLVLTLAPILAMMSSTTPVNSNGMSTDSVTVVGDVNGDGLGDILVTNTTYDPPYTTTGVIYNPYQQSSLFLGEADPSGTLIVKSLSNPDVGYSPYNSTYADLTDKSFALGDINGDGYQDFATVQESSSQSELSALVFLGGATPSTTAAYTIDDDGPTEVGGVPLRVTLSVTAGDFNGDGKPDLAVLKTTDLVNSNTPTTPPTPYSGRLYIFWSITDPSTPHQLTLSEAGTIINSDSTTGLLDAMSSTPGLDLDGDKISDLLLGAGGANILSGTTGALLASAGTVYAAYGAAPTYNLPTDPAILENDTITGQGYFLIPNSDGTPFSVSDSQTLIAPTAAPANGRFTGTAVFQIAYGTKSTTITFARGSANATPADLVANLNSALSAAGLGSLVVAGLMIQGGESLLTLSAESTAAAPLTISYAAGNPAASLGFLNGQLTANATSHYTLEASTVLTALAPAPAGGQLSGPAHLSLSLGSGQPISLTFTASSSNSALSNLATNINTALAAAGLAGEVSAGTSGDLLTFTALVSTAAPLSIRFPAADPAAELGFNSGQSSADRWYEFTTLGDGGPGDSLQVTPGPATTTTLQPIQAGVVAPTASNAGTTTAIGSPTGQEGGLAFDLSAVLADMSDPTDLLQSATLKLAYSSIADNFPTALSLGSHAVVGNQLFFAANNGLWSTTGTVASTVPITGFTGTPAQLTAAGSLLFFVVNNQLWVNNTAATSTVATLITTPTLTGVGSLTAVGSQLFFIANTELWTSNGTTAGTALVPSSRTTSISNVTALSGGVNIAGTPTLFFVTTTPTTLAQALYEVPVSSSPIQYSGPINSYTSFSWLAVAAPGQGQSSGALYFVSSSLLYTTNGTTTTAVDNNSGQQVNVGTANPLLTNVVDATGSSDMFFVFNGQLWKAVGTAALAVTTTLIQNADPSQLTASGGKLFFTANTGTGRGGEGTELWVSDGTINGTKVVKDINPGVASSNPISLTDVNGTLYFAANDGIDGIELWQSNGTTAGTVLVKDITSGGAGSYPSNLVNVDGTLFFTADTDGGQVQGGLQFGTSGTDVANGVTTDSSGNIYVIGTTTGPLYGKISSGATDTFVAKFSPLGVKIWGVQFDNGANSSTIGYGIALDSSGNIYITGDYSESGVTHGLDAWVDKLSSSNGSATWGKVLFSSGDDVSLSIAVDANSGNPLIDIAGYTTGYLGTSTGTNKGNADAWVGQYNSSGTLEWVQQFGTAGVDQALGVAVNSAGNIYVVGTAAGAITGFYQNLSGSTAPAAFVAEFSRSGTLGWGDEFGTGTLDTAQAVAVNPSGNIDVTGLTYGTLAPSIAGSGSGGGDIWLAQFSPTFIPSSTTGPNWIRQFGTSAFDRPNALAVNASGNIYLTGYTEGALGGPYLGGDAFHDDAWAADFSSTGYPVWLQQLASAGDDDGQGIAVDGSGQVDIVGYTDGSLEGTSLGGDDAFLARLDSVGLELWMNNGTAAGTSRVSSHLGTTITVTPLLGEGSDTVTAGVATAALNTAEAQTIAVNATSGVNSIDFSAALRANLAEGHTRLTFLVTLGASDITMDVQDSLFSPMSTVAGQTGLTITSGPAGVVADVYNAQGSLVASGQSLVDLSQFDAGTYYVRVRPAAGTLTSPIPFQITVNAPQSGQVRDAFHVDPSDRNTISGGDGNDTIISGGGLDELFGDGGDDTFFANPGEVRDLVTGDTFLARPVSDGGPGVAPSLIDPVVTAAIMPDPMLRLAVARALGIPVTLGANGAYIPARPIYVSDLAQLTQLDAGDYGIKDLEGLQFATNLTTLDLSNNSGITDLTWLEAGIAESGPLAGSPIGMAKLRYLAIDNDPVGNNAIAVLSTLVGLRGLSMDNTGLTELGSTSIALIGSTDLPANGQLSDQTMPSGAPVTTASFKLSVDGAVPVPVTLNIVNTAEDKSAADLVAQVQSALNAAGLSLSVLATLVGDTRIALTLASFSPANTLTIEDTNLVAQDQLGLANHETAIDVGSLAALTNLQFLSFDNNSVGLLADATVVGQTDLTNFVPALAPLATMTNLRVLSLQNNQVADISPLANLSSLQFLDLSNNQVSNIDALTGAYVTNNLDPGYAEVGPGWTGNQDPAAFDGDYRLLPGGDTSSQAVHTFSDLPAGTYNVLATWPGQESRSTQVIYTVDSGAAVLGNFPFFNTVTPTSAPIARTTSYQLTINTDTLTITGGNPSDPTVRPQRPDGQEVHGHGERRHRLLLLPRRPGHRPRHDHRHEQQCAGDRGGEQCHDRPEGHVQCLGERDKLRAWWKLLIEWQRCRVRRKLWGFQLKWRSKWSRRLLFPEYRRFYRSFRNDRSERDGWRGWSDWLSRFVVRDLAGRPQ